MFANWTAAEWTALATTGQFIATIIIASVAYWQLKSHTKQQKLWKTMQICCLYDCDAILDTALRRLSAARLDCSLTSSPKEYKYDAILVLNYLDGIAIGLAQNLYIEPVVRDHLEGPIRDHVRDFIGDSTLRNLLEINAEDYKILTDLCTKWSQNEPKYRDGFWSFGRS